jgi:hypothetical protein
MRKVMMGIPKKTKKEQGAKSVQNPKSNPKRRRPKVPRGSKHARK